MNKREEMTNKTQEVLQKNGGETPYEVDQMKEILSDIESYSKYGSFEYAQETFLSTGKFIEAHKQEFKDMGYDVFKDYRNVDSWVDKDQLCWVISWAPEKHKVGTELRYIPVWGCMVGVILAVGAVTAILSI